MSTLLHCPHTTQIRRRISGPLWWTYIVSSNTRMIYFHRYTVWCCCCCCCSCSTASMQQGGGLHICWQHYLLLLLFSLLLHLHQDNLIYSLDLTIFIPPYLLPWVVTRAWILLILLYCSSLLGIYAYFINFTFYIFITQIVITLYPSLTSHRLWPLATMNCVCLQL